MNQSVNQATATPITLLMNWNPAAKNWRAAEQVLTGRQCLSIRSARSRQRTAPGLTSLAPHGTSRATARPTPDNQLIVPDALILRGHSTLRRLSLPTPQALPRHDPIWYRTTLPLQIVLKMPSCPFAMASRVRRWSPRMSRSQPCSAGVARVVPRREGPDHISSHSLLHQAPTPKCSGNKNVVESRSRLDATN
jgi:hypothetical protein